MPPVAAPPRHELTSVADVAFRWSVSKDSVRRLIADGVLPAYRIPGLRGLRLRVIDVDTLPQLVDPNGYVDDEDEEL